MTDERRDDEHAPTEGVAHAQQAEDWAENTAPTSADATDDQPTQEWAPDSDDHTAAAAPVDESGDAHASGEEHAAPTNEGPQDESHEVSPEPPAAESLDQPPADEAAESDAAARPETAANEQAAVPAVEDDQLEADATRVQPRSSLISDELAPPLEPEPEPVPDSAAKTAVLATGPDDEPTQARPMATDDLYRPDPTLVAPAASSSTPTEDGARELSDEERKLAAERAARREARQAALAAADAPPPPAPEPVVVLRRSTDRFAGGLGLFLLRLVVAAIMLVRGLEIVTNLPAAEKTFSETLIPQPQTMALVTGVAALAIAVALVFGLLVRVAGLGVALIAAGVLVFVQWGNWSPFVPGRSGFLGEYELLLAAVGILFLLVGGGGFSLDRSFRKSRERSKLAREQAAS